MHHHSSCKRAVGFLSGLLALSHQVSAADHLLITEFLAANNQTLADENGDFPDWIEIFNAGTNAVNLDGWHLTDTTNQLARWRFPATNLNAGAYLVVFASGKDRRVPGAPLHTSFNLGASGEYLALVDPNTNVVSAYAPVFPRQVADVSFGIVTASDTFSLVATDAVARVLVPADGSLGSSWTAHGFDDGAWTAGINGVGFDIRSQQVFTDDFTTYHSYNGGSVTGTIWDGVVNAANLDPNSDTSGGVLHWRNTGEGWENANASAPFLYKLVNGDFDAQVDVAGVTVVTWSDGGLMARVANLADAGPGEDYVTAMLFSADTSANGQQNRLRSTDGGVTANFATSGVYGHRYLRLERVGNTFRYYTKANVGDAWGLRESLTRDDFPATLQVGLQHGTFIANAADRQYDNFVLTVGDSGSSLSYDTLIRTDIGAWMSGTNSSVYLRLPFTLTNAAAVTVLSLSLRYDDGFVAYLNGVEVARRNVPVSATWNSAASVQRARAEALSPEPIDLTAYRNLLLTGTNVLAIHGLNSATNDPRFLILADLAVQNNLTVEPARWRYFTVPTPGQPNGVGVTVLGAVVSDTQFSPSAPTDADDITVTARVRPTFDAVTNVALIYRVMFSNEVAIPMFDDGAHGDGGAGDGVFGATIPAAASAPGQMVRWYLTAQDALGTGSRWPVYEPGLELAQYFGAVIANPAITTPLPVFQYFIQDTNWYKLPNNGPYTKYVITNASVAYGGRFYDNVRVRIRGASSVVHKFPKQSLKFDFNPGERFVVAPDREPVTQANVNQFWTDKAYIRNNLSMEEVYAAAGVPAQQVIFLLTYLNGHLHTLAGYVEEPDERFLRRHGLDPDGALYKMYNPMSEASVRPPVPPGANPDGYGGAEKKTREWEDFSDLQAVVDGIKSSNPTRTQFIFDHLNVPEVINYCAASLVIQDWDRFPKNHFLYRDTLGTREWQILPWDADLSWGINFWFTDDITATQATFSHPYYGRSDYPGPYGQTHALFDALYRTPVLQQMFLRRARTLLDQILQAPGTPADQLKIEARINQLQPLLAADVTRDKQMWGNPFGTNQTFLQALTIIRTNYLAPRRTHLYVTHGPPNGLIPAAPFAYPTIQFAAIEFNPASGNQAEEYLQLTNAHPFAVDLSGWRLEGAARFAFRPGTVIPSNSVLYLSPDAVAFRARTTGPRGGQGLFVQGNYQGQLSARGESLELYDANGRLVRATNYPGAPSLAQQFLRITEIMYHPAPLTGNTNAADEFEYLELKNISTSATLNLNGVRFTNGLDFRFTGSAVTSLAAGQTVLLVRNPAAFAARYGSGFTIAGPFTGHLDNAGERLQLVDASGEEILDFRYDNAWYPITDGLGFSLVVADASAEPDAWNDPANWRPSGLLDGTPGVSEPAPPAPPQVVISEVLSRSENPPPTDSIELHHAGPGDAQVGGWFLTDDFFTPKKFRIPDSTVIPVGGYRVFTEADFNPLPGVPPNFALSADGDEVYLFAADTNGNLTGYVQGYAFGGADDGVSFGRHETSDGRVHFVAQTALTPDAANSGPRVGPVVISEILYHPPEAGAEDNTADEFIELQNITTNHVPLFHPDAPTNTLQLTGGVAFGFPTNVTLAPGQFALVVNFDPTNAVLLAAFRARYGVAGDVPVFGPYGGKLNNDADEVALRKPTLLRGTTLAQVQVDRVDYRDSSPWPGGADGFGLSLQRLDSAGFGNEPLNWTAAVPAPGGPTAVQGTAPAIVVQPASQTALALSPVTLSVAASGTPPLRYQWRHRGANVAGATNASLLFSRVLPDQSGDYEVVVFSAAGSVVSSNAALVVNVGPWITQQPTNQTLRQGSNATFAVAAFSASGTPLRYQWRAHGLDLPGRTNVSLTLTNVQTTNSGAYAVLITDAVGTVSSDPAMLQVTVLPVITLQPISQAVVSNATVTFTVAASGTAPLSYRWRKGGGTFTNGIILTQPTSSSLTLTNVRFSDAANYTVSIANLAGQAPLSTPAVLTVLADTDGDGLPDAWETANGFDPNVALDGLRDDDGDGMSNGAEYYAGTDYLDSSSVLRLEIAATNLALSFTAVSNRAYTLQASESLNPGLWLKQQDVLARTNTRLEVLTDPSPGTQRFYRVVTPIQR